MARKCNWQCYDAKSKECRCQCNGINHGVGKVQAQENFRRLGLIWTTSRTRRLRSSKRQKWRVPPEQGWLFPPGDRCT